MRIDLTSLPKLMACNPEFPSTRSSVVVDTVSNRFFPSETEPGTLYITTLAHLSGIQCFGSGAAIICIAGDEPSSEPLPPAVLAVLHAPVTPDQVYAIIMDRVFLTQKLFEAERKVLDAFVEGRRLPVLLNLAAGGLGSPFFFCDVDGDVIATSSDTNGAGERWGTLLESRRFDLQQILMGPGTTAKETDTNEVTMVEFSGGEMVAFTSVRVERTLIGFVGSLGAFSWNDPLLSDYIRHAARIVSAQMSKSDYYRSGQHGTYESFFRSILKESPAPEIIYARMKVRGITLKEQLEVLQVRPKDGGTFENAEEAVIRREIESLLGDCHSLVNKGALLFVIERDAGVLRADRPELAELEAYLRRHGLVGGLSNPFSEISALGTFCKQAEKAIFYANDVRKATGALSRFRDYIIDYLLEYCAAGFDLKTLRHPAIDTLLDYDAKMKTDYLETLRVYLANVGNMAKTAQELGVHYNTVKYRMQSIEQIAGISLKDSVTLLTLSLAFRINEGLGQFFLEGRA